MNRTRAGAILTVAALLGACATVGESERPRNVQGSQAGELWRDQEKFGYHDVYNTPPTPPWPKMGTADLAKQLYSTQKGTPCETTGITYFVVVDANGDVLGVHWNELVNNRCTEDARRLLMSTPFLPGEVDGKPIKSIVGITSGSR